MLKCVTDRHGVTPDVEIVLRSVARAHLRTGVPITTHTDVFTESGLAQQRIFRQEGVDLTGVSRRTFRGHDRSRFTCSA